MILARSLTRLGPLLVAATLLAACSTSATAAPSAATSPNPSVAPSEKAPGGSAGAPSASGCPTSQPAALPAGQTRTVTIHTAKGDIVIKVEGSLGPNAAGNFIALAACGYYDGVVFHRLVPGFVIQGGDGQFGRLPGLQSPAVGRGGPGYTFPDDPVTVPYARGTVAMANSGANTNGSQFFICLADLSSRLAPSYSVFGHVTAGMDVVDAIAAMPNSGGQENAALQPVGMDRVTVSNP